MRDQGLTLTTGFGSPGKGGGGGEEGKGGRREAKPFQGIGFGAPLHARYV